MRLLPLLFLAVGFLLAQAFHFQPLTGVSAQYLAVACLAGVDTVTGGIRSGLEGTFRNDVFVTGFFSNVAIAFFIAWLGDKIGVDLYLVAAIVMGTRVFTNLSLIRRILLTRWSDERARRERQRETQAAGEAKSTSAGQAGGGA